MSSADMTSLTTPVGTLSSWHARNAAFGAVLAFSLVYTIRYAHQQLSEIRRATQLASPPSSLLPSSDLSTAAGAPLADAEVPDLFNQSTEDAISEETLAELAFSPSLDMADASRRLVIDRINRQSMRGSDAAGENSGGTAKAATTAKRGGVWELMLANVAGRHGPEAQEQALVALRYFYARSPLPQRNRTLHAVVKSLVDRLPEVRQRRHYPDTDWKQRSQAERDALAILRCEAETNPVALLAATGLVEHWLAHYPFGGPSASQARRMDVVRALINGYTDDESLGYILAAFYYGDKNISGRQHLRRAGLIGSVLREGDASTSPAAGAGVDADALAVGVDPFGRSSRRGHGNDSRNANGEGDDFLFSPPETPPGERNENGESAEARLRRRRRNTVVAEASHDEEAEDNNIDNSNNSTNDNDNETPD